MWHRKQTGRPAWERQPDETDEQWAAFSEWLALDSRPTPRGPGSKEHGWLERGMAYDAHRSVLAAEATRQVRMSELRKAETQRWRAGNAALDVAARALERLDPEDVSPTAAAALLRVGAEITRAEAADSPATPDSPSGNVEALRERLRSLVARHAR